MDTASNPVQLASLWYHLFQTPLAAAKEELLVIVKEASNAIINIIGSERQYFTSTRCSLTPDAAQVLAMHPVFPGIYKI